MLYVLVENVSKSRLPLPKRGADGRRLVLEPGDTARFTRKELKNPLIARFLGSSLVEVEEVTPVPPAVKQPVVAPAPVVAPPKPEPKPAPAPEPEPVVVAEPVVEEEPAAEEVAEDPKEEVDMRSVYLDAPGITEDNVDNVMKAFPSISDIASSSKDKISSNGVSKAYAKRLRDWASEQ